MELNFLTQGNWSETIMKKNILKYIIILKIRLR